MDKRNLHTIKGIGIDTQKIQQIVTKEEKEDSMSIILEIYDEYYDKSIDFSLLDEFIEVVKEKNRE